MGTNFYIKKDGPIENVHIGKRISNGYGKSCTFIWAIDKLEAGRFLLKSENRNTAIIINSDDDKVYTGQEFIEMIVNECTKEDFRQIGTEFY